ncbi:MAG: hypothetical protein ABIM99_01760 [Candidatus Dojkabacteria bacterium]
MYLPDAIATLNGPDIIQIIESIKHEGVEEITEVNLENNYDAQLIYLYLTGTGEIPKVPMTIYEGISESNGQLIYIFVQGNGTNSFVNPSDFADILFDMKSEKFMSVRHSKRFLGELKKKNLDESSLLELPLIAYNVKSAALATDIPQVAFLNAFKIFHIKKVGSEEIPYTIKFNERGEYAFYRNIKSPKRFKESKTLSEIYPEVTEIELGGEAIFPFISIEKERELLTDEKMGTIEG